MFDIFCEDCIEMMSRLNDESIDLVITDPPYGVNFNKGFDDTKEYVEAHIDAWLREIKRLLKTGSHAYIFVPIKEIDLWVSAVKEVGLQYLNLLATNTYMSNNYLKNNFTYTNQPIIFASKGTPKRLNKVDFIPTSESWLRDKRNKNPHPYTYQYPSFLPFFSNEKSTSKNNKNTERHPCTKSIPFIEFLVKLSSEPGDTVLDPFVGGGSTGVAAVRNGRKFIGSEINSAYFLNAKSVILSSCKDKNYSEKEENRTYSEIQNNDFFRPENSY